MKEVDTRKLYELFLESGKISTDTRKIEAGSIFFALKGENFDGNNFVRNAIDNGAMYAVTDNHGIYNKAIKDEPQRYGERLLLVKDVLTSLQQLARYNRLQYRIPVIAITGTNGKTTTKELITATLATKYNVVSTIGNLNNHIGVPLTLMRIDSSTEVAVIEMGASAPGEIKSLAEIVCPSFGLITNVGKAHLLGFGSFEGVKRTKGELYSNLQEHKKIAFVNIDNKNLMEMLRNFPQLHIVPYGVKNNCAKILYEEENPFLKLTMPNPDIKEVDITSGDSFSGREITISTKLIGEYNADNVMAAMCVSSYFNIPAKDAVRAIEEYTPSNNRSQLTKTGKNDLIIDAYNANPTSMRASLENFRKLQFSNKRLILGDMLELGENSAQEHKNIIELALQLEPEEIYTVGEEFAKAAAEFPDKGIKTFSDSIELKEFLHKEQPSGKRILIKGSRGTKLERVIEVL